MNEAEQAHERLQEWAKRKTELRLRAKIHGFSLECNGLLRDNWGGIKIFRLGDAGECGELMILTNDETISFGEPSDPHGNWVYARDPKDDSHVLIPWTINVH